MSLMGYFGVGLDADFGVWIGFVNDMALVLYVYLPGSWNGEESCLTVS